MCYNVYNTCLFQIALSVWCFKRIEPWLASAMTVMNLSSFHLIRLSPWCASELVILIPCTYLNRHLEWKHSQADISPGFSTPLHCCRCRGFALYVFFCIKFSYGGHTPYSIVYSMFVLFYFLEIVTGIVEALNSTTKTQTAESASSLQCITGSKMTY